MVQEKRAHEHVKVRRELLLKCIQRKERDVRSTFIGASAREVDNRDEVAAALDMYFEINGWDEKSGNPTKAKLDELGLGWVTG